MNIDTETYKPGLYVHLINRAKDRLMSAHESAQADFSSDPHFYDVYGTYENTLGRENLLDFGDLIYVLSRGLAQKKTVLERLKEMFRYVLVDEFQDTNHAQYELIKQLTYPEGNICVVGDDDQSIYGFRGARVENVMNFSKDYKKCRIIKLEENYRSYQTILTASSTLINNNSGRLGKTLYTNKGKGEKLVFCQVYSDYDEARFIAGKVQDLVLDGSYNYRDIAIFYRMNAQSRVFESVFNHGNIPYIIIGGLRFYERQEIKDILSYIRVIINPMDEIALRRISNKPPRGIGEKTTRTLIEASIERGVPLFQTEEILRCIQCIPSRKNLVRDFIKMLAALKIQMDRLNPPDFLKKLFYLTGYVSWLQDEHRDEKVRNLEELFNAVDEFYRNNPSSSITEFVEEVSLYQGARDEEFQKNCIHLITLHNAKGLEFPVVFMAGMEEGIFPHYLSGEALRDLQEERRLCYVGMTRAMEKLYLTAARTRMLYGKTVERDNSIFIYEIPDDILVRMSVQQNDYSKFRFHNGFPNIGEHSVFSKNAGSTRAQLKKKSNRREIEGIVVDTRVIHDHFGKGIVLNLTNGIATIRFDDGNVMKFMLSYTPIRKA
jgi:DNA helicase-2/ATP-dependent DNA helicase PcrA